MIKGTRWYFVVLLLAASPWIASSLSNDHRVKRQLRNSIYQWQLRNGRYLLPIPIRIPPYIKAKSQPDNHASDSNRGTVHSSWIPYESTSSDDSSRKNVYVPPIPPPEIIVTAKPSKITFDVPLTKSIQVSRSRPGIQTTGYIKKSLVKIHATRTTTENPLSNVRVAESTVQTLLNFNPIDDGWRPTTFTTLRPAVVPNRHVQKNLGSKYDKQLNYTGMRYGKINTVMKSRPQNSASLKVLKNETNFVMKFTPEDVKFSSVEVKAEKVDAPFYVDSPEVKHLTGKGEENRAFADEFGSSVKTATDLRNEGNIPYQGHKTPMEPVVVNSRPAKPFKDSYNKDRKTVFDNFPNVQKTNSNSNQKDFVPFEGEGSFVTDPLGARKIISASRTREKEPNHKGQTNRLQNQRPKNPGPAVQASQYDQTYFSKPFDAFAIDSDKNIKASFPYQGHATVIRQPSSFENSDYSPKDPSDFPYLTQQTFRKPPSNINLKENEDKLNSSTINYNGLNSASQNFTVGYGINNPYATNKGVPPISPNSFKYSEISDPYKINNTSAKEAITIAEVPLTIGVEYDTSVSSSGQKVSEIQNSNKGTDVTSNHENKLYQSSPNPQNVLPISHEDAGKEHKNHNNRLIKDYSILSRPAFDQDTKLEEIEMKNPPDYFQFGNEDFLKPVIPVRFEKENEPAKTLSSFTFSLKDKLEHLNNKENKESLEKDRNQPNGSPEISLTSAVQKPFSKVEYYENSKFEDKKPSEEVEDSVYFQPVFPEIPLSNHQNRFQNYNNDQTPMQIPGVSKEVTSNANFPFISKPGKENVNPTSNDSSKAIISKDVIVTKKIQTTKYSSEESKRDNTRGPSSDIISQIITHPPVITVKFDQSDSMVNKRGSIRKINRTENYVIHRKPSLIPEGANRPRKPNVTISSGMLAGILIAALVFLGFLTGSMVYAFHQWKFSRCRKEKKKKARNTRYPPEYLDENFAGNTYIHNNIFLPTPQNMEDRNTTDQDSNSITGEITYEPPSSSSRAGRYKTYRDAEYD